MEWHPHGEERRTILTKLTICVPFNMACGRGRGWSHCCRGGGVALLEMQ